MPSRHKAKEMKRRASQRKATHKARARSADGSGDNQSRKR